jgi:hypothetical protein
MSRTRRLWPQKAVHSYAGLRTDTLQRLPIIERSARPASMTVVVLLSPGDFSASRTWGWRELAQKSPEVRGRQQRYKALLPAFAGAGWRLLVLRPLYTCTH